MGSERKGCYRPLTHAQAKTGQLRGLFSKSWHRTVGEEEDAVFISASSVCGNGPLIKVFLMLHTYTHVYISRHIHRRTGMHTQTHMQRNVCPYTYAHIHYRGIHRDIHTDSETHTHTYLHTFLPSANPLLI